MGLFDFLWRLIFGSESTRSQPSQRSEGVAPATSPTRKRPVKRRKVKLLPLRYDRREFAEKTPLSELMVPTLPYPFARKGVLGGYLDLQRGGDDAQLQQLGLPKLQTLQELANWLEMPLGRVAWLTHRCEDGGRTHEERRGHYSLHWIEKPKGGYRLIEAPKPLLKRVQQKILREILDRIPCHEAVHGFVKGKSIRSNAAPHAGQRVVVKFDLENFYPSVSFTRVVAVFRALGFSREVAIWLGRLTTTSLPINLVTIPSKVSSGKQRQELLRPYRRRHLPQGAPTSPALANLSGFPMDVRLAGMARTFHANYTRYADDLTFSGEERFLRSLSSFLPLVQRIIRSEMFRLHPQKRRILRNSQQQRVTGVIVNQRVNSPRKEYDRLKAILTNCELRGPSTQNHQQVRDFSAQLRGRISHVAFLNPARGQKLREIFERIDWRR